MKEKIILIFVFFSTISITSFAQITEPEFIGDAIWVNGNESKHLSQEMGSYKSGMSILKNSWNLLTLELPNKESKIRFPNETRLSFIVKCIENSSNPISIIKILKLDSKRKKRSVEISQDNSGDWMKKSKTNTKNDVTFKGEKYGESSYLVQLKDIEPGEYGIIVSNPNSVDEKRTIVSTFGID